MTKRRKRGSGSIYQRKDGRWEGRYVVGYDEDGLPRTKNVLAKTKSECAAKLKALKDSILKEEPERPKADLTFGAWLDRWYQEQCKPTIKPKTQADYENRIYQHIIPEVGQISLSHLTQSDLQQFYHRLKQGGRLLRADLYGPGLSDRMVKSCHVTCRLALDQAVKEGLIITNPASFCKAPVTHPKEMELLSKDEVQRLLIQAKEDSCYELLLLELSTGLRRGEICALQWDDLNLRTGELRVQRQVHRIKSKLVASPPKTKAGNRSVILPAPVLNVLKAYKETISSRWMFPSPVSEDSPRDPAAVRKRLQTVLERAECKKIRFHDLRHTFSTTALEHGMDIKTLSTIIGHVSSSTTLNIYAHVTDEMRRTAAVKIDQGIGKTELQAERQSAPRKPAPSTFQAHKGQRRKAGTGCVTQINEKLWEGRYSPIWPDGKKRPRNVYAHSEEECEKLLAEMIVEMKTEIAAERERLKAG